MLNIVNWLADTFKKENGVDLKKDRFSATSRLKHLKKAKIEAPTAMQTEINIPFITSGADGLEHLLVTFTRAKLEESLPKEFIDRAMMITKKAMDASPFKVGDFKKSSSSADRLACRLFRPRSKPTSGKEPT